MPPDTLPNVSTAVHCHPGPDQRGGEAATGRCSLAQGSSGVAQLGEVRSSSLAAFISLDQHHCVHSGSRLSFGVVYEKRVVMVIDSSASERAELKAFLRVATSVIREQLCHADSFNIIWYSHLSYTTYNVRTMYM